MKSLESVNRRIHDDVPLEHVKRRASAYVADMINTFPYAPLQNDAAVMEIGSGTGYIMEALDTYAKSREIRLQRIVGLDIAEHMIEKAKSRLGKRRTMAA